MALFKDNDQMQVPLVWNHNHATPNNVLGHVLLHSQEEPKRAVQPGQDQSHQRRPLHADLVMNTDAWDKWKGRMPVIYNVAVRD